MKKESKINAKRALNSYSNGKKNSCSSPSPQIIYSLRGKEIIYRIHSENSWIAKGILENGILTTRNNFAKRYPKVEKIVRSNFNRLYKYFHNLFPLHSNMLIFNKNLSILIAGPSGGGKSTLSQIITRYNKRIEGYLEDIVYIRANRKTVEALAFVLPRRTRTRSLTIDAEPRKPVKWSISESNLEAKSIVNTYRKTWPVLFLFTEIKKRRKTVFFKLCSTQILQELMKNSFFRTKSKKSPVYLNHIMTFLLASRIKSYKIELGKDTKNNPEFLYKIIKTPIEDTIKYK